MEYSSRYINLENKRELFETSNNIYSFISEDDFYDAESDNTDYSEYSFFNDILFEKTYNEIKESGYRLTNGVIYHLNSLTGVCKSSQIPILEERFDAIISFYDNQFVIQFNDDGTWQENTNLLCSGVYKRNGCFIKMLNTLTRTYSYIWYHGGKYYRGDTIYVCENLHEYLTEQFKVI